MTDGDNKQILIGLLSDTHIPSRSGDILPKIFTEFHKKDVDYVFHLGDFTDLETYKRIVDEFGEEKVIAISGNMDGSEITSKLPESREVEILGNKIFLTHGSGGPKGIIRRLNRAHDLKQYDIVVFGHTHGPVNKTKDGTLYFNPGTPTDKRFAKVNTYGYITLTSDSFKTEIVHTS